MRRYSSGRHSAEASVMTLDEMKSAGHRVLTKEYSSMGEFLDDARGMIAYNRFGRAQHGEDWHGASSFAAGAQIIRRGIPNFRDDINSLVDKVSVSLPSTQDAWVNDVSGVCPVVPMAIAGLPDNMLRLEQQETTGVPLRVFVSTAYSGGCSRDVIERRGVAIMALLESLAAKRPVELLLFAEFDDANGKGLNTPIVRVDSMPLDQSTLTAALVSPVVSRMMFMGWCEENAGFRGGWAWGGMAPSDPRAQALTREALGASPTDLVIFAAFLDESDLILSDPLAWVQQQVALTEANLNAGA
jgi:hypothetical protein